MDIDAFLKQKHDRVVESNPDLLIPIISRRERRWSVVILFGMLSVSILVGVFLLIVPTKKFPQNQFISIKKGAALSTIATQLKNEEVIRSRQVFQLLVMVSGGADLVKAGEYVFKHPLGTLGVARRMIRGEYGQNVVRLTILESSSLQDIAGVAARVLRDFNTDYFIEQAVPYNGYLFPDTYFLRPTTSEDELIQIMRDEFAKKIHDITGQELINMSPETLREKVIMASIVEREAAGVDDSALIAGILYKRMKLGMPLQVDASFAYLFDKESSELTRADLKFDSPYNTYLYKGLPPGPLGNPGKGALQAAFYPADSPYLYYLHSADGTAHFGKNFQEHINNKKKYLN